MAGKCSVCTNYYSTAFFCAKSVYIYALITGGLIKPKRDRYTEEHNKYYALVFNVIYTKVGSKDDAADVCQEVFLKFFEKFDEIENYRKWLFGAMRLALFEYYRKKRSDVDIDEVFNDMSLTFVNGFRDARIMISEAIENMKIFDGEEDKTLFDLIAVHNYSYSDTAKELHLTKRMVEYRYRRIVDSIIDYLHKKGLTNIEDLL